MSRRIAQSDLLFWEDSGVWFGIGGPGRWMIVLKAVKFIQMRGAEAFSCDKWRRCERPCVRKTDRMYGMFECRGERETALTLIDMILDYQIRNLDLAYIS